MLGLLSLLLLLLLVFGFVLGIVFWATSGGGKGSDEMSCGGCGYAVRGLKALNCPECGADLRKVGINRGRSSGRRGMGIALTVCCGGLLMLSVGMFAFFLLAKNSSMSQATKAQQTIQQQSTSATQQTAIDDAIDDNDSETPPADTP